MTTPRRPLTPVLAGAFSTIAAIIAATAAITLLVPQTPLSAIWAIKPKEYAELLAFGPLVGAGFVVLAAFAIATAVGTFGRWRWGWWLAVVGLTINGLSDAARVFTGAVLEGLIGVVIAGALVWWLSRRRVRAQFDR